MRPATTSRSPRPASAESGGSSPRAPAISRAMAALAATTRAVKRQGQRSPSRRTPLSVTQSPAITRASPKARAMPTSPARSGSTMARGTTTARVSRRERMIVPSRSWTISALWAVVSRHSRKRQGTSTQTIGAAAR